MRPATDALLSESILPFDKLLSLLALNMLQSPSLFLDHDTPRLGVNLNESFASCFRVLRQSLPPSCQCLWGSLGRCGVSFPPCHRDGLRQELTVKEPGPAFEVSDNLNLK
jgi:hypothetical protein